MKPPWLRQRFPEGPVFGKVTELLENLELNTVCREARCPNRWECFSRKTAAFLIMGNRCTRGCRFCSIGHGPAESPDPDEPARVAEAARKMGLNYVVVTSVTRDDLADGGASCFMSTIEEIHRQAPRAKVEILTPDFQGDRKALNTALRAGPAVFNHNVETVPRLYPRARPQADYNRSLELLKAAKEIRQDMPVKSGLMLGLGETAGEIEDVMRDLYAAGCSLLTLGQYLQPAEEALPVERFVHPDEFIKWRKKALEIGFMEVASGPLVRSSYHAHELYSSLKPNPALFSGEPETESDSGYNQAICRR
ncbi:MAG: lipoyl synthase [Desulfobia sp.]